MMFYGRCVLLSIYEHGGFWAHVADPVSAVGYRHFLNIARSRIEHAALCKCVLMIMSHDADLRAEELNKVRNTVRHSGEPLAEGSHERPARE